MRARLLVIALALGAASLTPAAARPNYPSGALARQQQILPHIGPVTRAWIAGEAHRLADGTTTDVAGDIRGANLGIPAGADIEALAFVVLMQATDDQDQDLKQIMNEVQAQTKAKQALRQQMQTVNTEDTNAATNSVGASGEGPRGRRLAGPGGRVDQASDISQQLQLKLQLAQERYSQLMEMLSNTLKQISDTQSQIIANMK